MSAPSIQANKDVGFVLIEGKNVFELTKCDGNEGQILISTACPSSVEMDQNKTASACVARILQQSSG